ncbi:group II intron maturase-specific domain-containing protein [Nocardia vaccinii]|uniref:group II intron maturase-specific domain-containing protein n=1 Tax=Nocardia vaccinii TaxID=1822 RepID=UPI000A00F3CC
MMSSRSRGSELRLSAPSTPDEQDITAGPRAVLIRLDQIMGGWVAYLRHMACKTTLKPLDHFMRRRITSWCIVPHHCNWTDLR